MAQNDNYLNAAQQRVEEMQRRSRSYIQPPPRSEPVLQPEPPPPPPPPIPPCADFPPKKGVISNLLDSLLPGMEIDEERLLILFILIILAKNGSNIKLLLALGYLLL